MSVSGLLFTFIGILVYAMLDSWSIKGWTSIKNIFVSRLGMSFQDAASDMVASGSAASTARKGLPMLSGGKGATPPRNKARRSSSLDPAGAKMVSFKRSHRDFPFEIWLS